MHSVVGVYVRLSSTTIAATKQVASQVARLLGLKGYSC